MSKITTKTENNQDEKILMPYTYIQQVPGKQIRQKLASAFNYWLKISEDKLKAVGEIVQILHNASLLTCIISKLKSEMPNKDLTKEYVSHSTISNIWKEREKKPKPFMTFTD